MSFYDGSLRIVCYSTNCKYLCLKHAFLLFDHITEFQMTEKDFWNKYFRAEYLHSTKNVVAAAAEAAEDEELAIFLREDEILAREARQKVRCIESFQLLTFLR